MEKTNRQILTKCFLSFDDTELRRLKQYADAGKTFLCGRYADFYCFMGKG